LTYVQANAKKLGISEDKLQKTNVHIHVPEGAVPKDGPSAGITICTAIISAFTNTPIRRHIAMTGEITLRGRVMRIGGLKEKSIAAHQAGCKFILIPKDNVRDLVEVPDSVKKDIEFKPVSHMDEVVKLALADGTLSP
jgi:ATP-dependent Lon protease